MNQRTTSRLTQVVTPTLAPGEQIEMIEGALVGKISAKKRLAVTAAVTVASAGTVMVALKPQGWYLVLTNQRLIFIENKRGIVGKIAAAARRENVTAEPLRGHFLTLSMNVTIDGTPQRFSWGRAQPGMARRVAAALAAPGQVPAA
jgi:hypothetical protein